MTEDSHGGYATVIPSKFISPDGREMWLNANTFAGRTVVNYGLSMRRLLVTPWRPTTPSNPKSDVNLAVVGRDVTPISRMRARGGSIWSLNDGDKSAAVDSFNLERKPLDWWGYTWSQSYHMNEVVYTAGPVIANMGGWFKDLRVQVRQNHRWIDVTNLSISPDYPFDPGAAAVRTGCGLTTRGATGCASSALPAAGRRLRPSPSLRCTTWSANKGTRNRTRCPCPMIDNVLGYSGQASDKFSRQDQPTAVPIGSTN